MLWSIFNFDLNDHIFPGYFNDIVDVPIFSFALVVGTTKNWNKYDGGPVYRKNLILCTVFHLVVGVILELFQYFKKFTGAFDPYDFLCFTIGTIICLAIVILDKYLENNIQKSPD